MLYDIRLSNETGSRVIDQIIESAECKGVPNVELTEVLPAIQSWFISTMAMGSIKSDTNVSIIIDDEIKGEIVILEDDNIIERYGEESFMEHYEDDIIRFIESSRISDERKTQLADKRRERRRTVDYRYDPNRWIQVMLINKDTMERIVNEIATEANVSYDDAYYGLLNEQLTDSIDGPCVTDEPMDDIRIVNGHRDRTFRIYTEFSFMVEYKDRVLRRLANQ